MLLPYQLADAILVWSCPGWLAVRAVGCDNSQFAAVIVQQQPRGASKARLIKSKISTVRLGLASCGVELDLRTKVILQCLMLQKAPFSTKTDILAKLGFYH